MPVSHETVDHPLARSSTPDLSKLLRWGGAWAFPFVLVVYLGLSGGGYDAVVRGEVGILAWWCLLLGTAAGALPLWNRRLGRPGWIALGLFGAFTILTALGLIGTESTERTLFELGRVATLLGIFALAISLQGRNGLRRMIGAVASAIVTIGGLALLSRIEPEWFPASSTAEFLPSVANRLNYPLDYWNGLAALMAIGIPLLLTQSLTARHVTARAAAAAGVPLLTLAAFLTLSRGGFGALLAGVLTLVLLSPRRLALLPLVALTAGASALLLVAADQREEFMDAASGSMAAEQGSEMFILTLIVCGGTALVAAALALAIDYGFARAPDIRKRLAAAVVGGFAMLALGAFLAAEGPEIVSDEWKTFKQPLSESTSTSSVERFASANGSNRYQYWSSAMDANRTAPLFGIGPGTFEFWWAAEGTEPGFVRDAHSLYVEVLAEYGIVGLVVLLALLLLPLGYAAGRTRTGGIKSRRLAAGAAAAMVSFLLAAGVDWAWELTVLPVVFFLLAASILGTSDAGEHGVRDSARIRSRWSRFTISVVAIVMLAAVAVPLAALKSIRASQAAAAAGDDVKALTNAADAERLLPSLATPHLQQALILESAGELDLAAAAAGEAVAREQTNWRTWLTLARVEARRGKTAAALRAFRRARELNPRSALFIAGSDPRPGRARNGP